MTAHDDVNDYWSYPVHTSGQASTLPYSNDDVITLLHEVIKEITGEDVTMVKPRMGFLP